MTDETQPAQDPQFETKDDALDALRRVTRRLDQKDADAADLRTQRDRLIRVVTLVHSGTEREAAEAANVSPAYAHRVKVAPPEQSSDSAAA